MIPSLCAKIKITVSFIRIEYCRDVTFRGFTNHFCAASSFATVLGFAGICIFLIFNNYLQSMTATFCTTKTSLYGVTTKRRATTFIPCKWHRVFVKKLSNFQNRFVFLFVELSYSYIDFLFPVVIFCGIILLDGVAVFAIRKARAVDRLENSLIFAGTENHGGIRWKLQDEKANRDRILRSGVRIFHV